MEELDKVNKVLYVYAPGTDILFEKMLTALRDRGYRIVSLEKIEMDRQGFCLVYITDELICQFGDAKAVNNYLDSASLDFIPVIQDENSSQQKEILTQYFYTPLDEHSIFNYVSRIDLLISMGSGRLNEWNRIHSLALKWNANGQAVQDLLNKVDFLAADDLLRHPIHEMLSKDEALVRSIVSATRRRLRWRKTMFMAVGFLVGIMFLISGIFAVVSKRRADDAALYARIQTNSTVADRLSVKALEMMTTDPDLPWILMDKALSLSETQESVAAAYEVSGNLIAHKSYRLPSIGAALGYLGNNMCAIGLADGKGVIILDASSGEICYADSATAGGEHCYISVSPDNKYFAADYSSIAGDGGGTKFYRWADGAAEWLSLSEVQIDSFVWLGEEHIIAIVDQKLCTVNVLTGRVENSLPIETEGIPIAVASDGKAGSLFVAVVKDEALGIAVYSLSEKKLLENIPIEGFGQMCYDSVTKTLLVDTGVTAILIDIAKVTRGEKADVRQIGLPFTRTLGALTADQSGAFYFGSASGAICVLMPCRSAPMGGQNHIFGNTDFWAYESGFTDEPRGAVLSHQSNVHDVIMLEGGKWASVGADGMLRIWNRSIYERLNASLEVQPNNDSTRTPALKNAIRITLGRVDESTMAVMSSDGFSRVVFERDTLLTVRNDYGWMLGQAKVAYDTGDAVVVHGSQDGYTFSLVPGSYGIGKYRDISRQDAVNWLFALLDISRDGSTVYGLLPSGINRGIYCVKKDSGESDTGRFDIDSNMIYLKALTPDNAMAISSEGEVFWIDGKKEYLFKEMTALTAAAHISGNQFLSLDIDGQIWLTEDFGSARTIGYFAPANEGFAIRVSSSGRLAAIIGEFETQILDIETGQVAAVLNNLFSQYTTSGSASVHDVLFDPDDRGMVVVYSNGWISRVEFMERGDILGYVHENCPRQASAEEEQFFAIPD